MAYPQYVSHKQVGAVKIRTADKRSDGGVTIEVEGGFAALSLSAEQLRDKPKPEAGWYLVHYPDGYQSFSPAESFESGYTPLEPEPVEEETKAKADPPATPKDDKEIASVEGKQ